MCLLLNMYYFRAIQTAFNKTIYINVYFSFYFKFSCHYLNIKVDKLDNAILKTNIYIKKTKKKFSNYLLLLCITSKITCAKQLCIVTFFDSSGYFFSITSLFKLTYNFIFIFSALKTF